MSTTVLRTTIKVGGVLTDPDGNAVTIIAPGVVRTDTGGVVVAGPVSMTRASTGSYAYSVVDPAYGLTYSWTPQCTIGGVLTTSLQAVTPGTAEPGTGNLPSYPNSFNFLVLQSSTPLFSFPPLVDPSGNAIDLTGKSIELVVSLDNGVQQIGVFEYPGIISGAENNIVSVQFEEADTATAQVYSYGLGDATDGIGLYQGVLAVTPLRVTVP